MTDFQPSPGLGDRMDGDYRPPILEEPQGGPIPGIDAEEAAGASADEADVNRLKQFWLHGDGLKKWANSPHPWTALHRELAKHVGDERAKRIASQWYFEHFGHWPGQHHDT